jgi:hypothetical protein
MTFRAANSAAAGAGVRTPALHTIWRVSVRVVSTELDAVVALLRAIQDVH